MAKKSNKLKEKVNKTKKDVKENIKSKKGKDSPKEFKSLASFYAASLKEVEDDLSLVSNSMIESERVSTGTLCIDWIFGGGLVPGMTSFAGEEQTGKCVVGNTMVNTNHGFLEMREFISKKGFNEVDNITITTNSTPKKVSHLFKEKSETIKIVTESGIELEGTPEHRMLILDENLDFKWKRLDKLTVEDWIVGSSKTSEPLFGDNPYELTKSLASIMGYLTANGTKAQFFTGDETVASRFTKAVTNEGAKVTVVTTKDRVNRYDITTGGNYNFYDRLNELGYNGATSNSKSVPLSVRMASKEVIHEFLEAYFECDSGVNKNSIVVSSASKQLVNQLNNILLEVYKLKGRKSSCKKSALNSRNPKVREYYNISYKGLDAENFLKSFKRAKVHRYVDRFNFKKSTSSGTIIKSVPYVRKAVELAYTKAKVTSVPGDSRVHLPNGDIVSNFYKPKFIRPSFCGRNNNHYASELLFEQTDWNDFIPHVAKIDPSLSKKLDKIRTKSYRYDRVSSVKTTRNKKLVYDVTVPDGHAFIANGLVSHNTTAGYHTLAQAHGVLKLPYVGLYDAEGAVSPKYTGKIWEPFGMDVKHLISKAGREDGFYYFRDQVIEKMFDYLKRTLAKMPDKNWNSNIGSWCYYMPKRDEYFKKLMQFMGLKVDQAASSGGNFYICPTDNTGPEGFFMVDSFAALLTREEELKDETGDSHQNAKEASAFSKHLKRVKVDLAEKKVVMLGTNQLGSHVRKVYGHPDDQLYEKGGNALKYYSEARGRLFSRSGSAGVKLGPFQADKDNSKFGIEDSVEYAGGKDRYAIKEVKNTKNKFGPPGLKTFIRVWVSDGKGRPRGIDPVFDVFHYLTTTGQLVKVKGNVQFKLKDSVGRKRAGKLNSLPPFKFSSLKTLVIAEYINDADLLRKALKQLGASFKPNLRESLFKQLKSDDSVYSTVKDINKTEDEYMEDNDADYEQI